MPRPKPGDRDWNDWARLANAIGDACQKLDRPLPLLFSERTTVAEHLWDVGYRIPAPKFDALSRPLEEGMTP